MTKCTLVVIAMIMSGLSARAGSADCTAQVRKMIEFAYNDGLQEMVSMDGPFSWTADGKVRHAYLVTYCNPGDTSSKAKRKANCMKTRARELRIATCEKGKVVDTNGDKFVDLSDLVRGLPKR